MNFQWFQIYTLTWFDLMLLSAKHFFLSWFSAIIADFQVIMFEKNHKCVVTWTIFFSSIKRFHWKWIECNSSHNINVHAHSSGSHTWRNHVRVFEIIFNWIVAATWLITEKMLKIQEFRITKMVNSVVRRNSKQSRQFSFFVLLKLYVIELLYSKQIYKTVITLYSITTNVALLS